MTCNLLSNKIVTTHGGAPTTPCRPLSTLTNSIRESRLSLVE
jgi:hypothetical protein